MQHSFKSPRRFPQRRASAGKAAPLEQLLQAASVLHSDWHLVLLQ